MGKYNRDYYLKIKADGRYQRWSETHRKTEKGKASMAEAKWRFRGISDMTWERYQEMFQAQEGRCAISGCTFKHPPNRRLHVDHDHKTGKARALLCSTHNSLVGHVENGRIAQVEAYLERH